MNQYDNSIILLVSYFLCDSLALSEARSALLHDKRGRWCGIWLTRCSRCCWAVRSLPVESRSPAGSTGSRRIWRAALQTDLLHSCGSRSSAQPELSASAYSWLLSETHGVFRAEPRHTLRASGGSDWSPDVLDRICSVCRRHSLTESCSSVRARDMTSVSETPLRSSIRAL